MTSAERDDASLLANDALIYRVDNLTKPGPGRSMTSLFAEQFFLPRLDGKTPPTKAMRVRGDSVGNYPVGEPTFVNAHVNRPALLLHCDGQPLAEYHVSGMANL